MKLCIKCGKFSDNFGKHKGTKDKLDSWCKPCKHEDGRIRLGKAYETKEGQIVQIHRRRKSVAKLKNIPFEITAEYLIKIATDNCPVFGTPLSWGKRNGKPTENSPSLDKFKPELGYVEGNVCWISFKANTMKQRATAAEVEALANWMKQIENQ